VALLYNAGLQALTTSRFDAALESFQVSHNIDLESTPLTHAYKIQRGGGDLSHARVDSISRSKLATRS